jgi:hypothetical protein
MNRVVAEKSVLERLLQMVPKGSLPYLFSSARVQRTATSRFYWSRQRSFTKGFTESAKSPTKAFPKVSLDESPTYALGGEAAHSSRPQGIEQTAAQYAASRAHAGLQMPRARQLEAFHGKDVRSTST